MVEPPPFSSNLEEFKMKAIKTLLAVSVLAAAGAAHATAFDITISGSSTQFPGGLDLATINQSGTYDDVLGAGSVTGIIAVTPHGAPAPIPMTITNAITMDTATGKGKYNAGTNCTDSVGGQLCGGLGPQFHGNLTATQPFPGAGGGSYNWNLSVVYLDSDSNPVTLIVPFDVALTPQAPAVPVPAAAWLFGSGLLGLAGTARRRRNTTAT
jgi:hypothetical protein